MPVEFDEARYAPAHTPAPGTSKLSAWLIKRGYAKNQQNANVILIVVAIGCFLTAIFIMYMTLTGSADDSSTLREVELIPASSVR